MSGFTNVTGIAPPTSLAGFMGLLQMAYFRGVPFKVVGAHVRKGRRLAVHEYPFRDGGWPEDMGRALRTYSFTGYLIGDLAPVMQLALDTMIERKGPGLLIHPTIGAVYVDVMSATTAVHKDRMRVIAVAFEFMEHSDVIFPSAIIATAIAVLAATSSVLSAGNSDMGNSAGPAAALGPQVTSTGVSVVSSFVATTTAAGTDPTAIVGMAAALSPPNSDTTYGRYGAGSARSALPTGTTVAALQGKLANQRAALAQAGAAGVSVAASYSGASNMLGALSAIVEAMRGGMTDPADQVRVLLGMAGFSVPYPPTSTTGTGAAQQVMRTAMTDACLQAVAVSLALASSSYQPASYDDAAAVRTAVADALGLAVTAAGDAGNDATYMALKGLRAAVIRDMTVRGASLPTVVAVSFPLNLPSLVIAQKLYGDAGRADEIAAESGAVHPAFCPMAFQALSA